MAAILAMLILVTESLCVNILNKIHCLLLVLNLLKFIWLRYDVFTYNNILVILTVAF